MDIIQKRRSIRSFLPDPVSDEKARKLLECANLAPSAGNLQGYEVVVVRSTETKKALAKAALDQQSIAEAPVVFVFCANAKRSASKYGKRGDALYSTQDATIATAYVQLACVDLGLGSVWVGAFNDHEVAKVIQAGLDYTPVSILPVGYPAEDPSPRSRRGVDSITHWERL
jgi:nitroreductase